MNSAPEHCDLSGEWIHKSYVDSYPNCVGWTVRIFKQGDTPFQRVDGCEVPDDWYVGKYVMTCCRAAGVARVGLLQILTPKDFHESYVKVCTETKPSLPRGGYF